MPYSAFADAGLVPEPLDTVRPTDISNKSAVLIPLIITAATIAVAATISLRTGVVGSTVFLPYLSGWTTATFIAVAIWSFILVGRLALAKSERPLETLVRKLTERSAVLMIPVLIFPAFLGAYTWTKVSIPFAVGYEWEGFWADADLIILGRDAWTFAHALSPPFLAGAWSIFYTVVWGLSLLFGGALIACFASRRTTATFYTAMMLSWSLGGILLAYLISAAGPVFAHLVDPALGARFAPLRADLLDLLGPDNLVVRAQRYLATNMHAKVALNGSGISAMPSMHIATVTIFVLAARGSAWLPLALLFWALTFFGSVYFGYHYVVDAPVAVIVAASCWYLTRLIYAVPPKSPMVA